MNTEKKLSVADRVAEALTRIALGLCIALFAVMVFSVAYGVIGRYIPFIRNPRWTQELAILCMVWICFVSSGYAIKNGFHVRMTIFVGLFPKKVEQTFHMLSYVLLLAVNLFWIIYGSQLMGLTHAARMAATGWPMSLTYLSVVAGGVYGAAMALYRLIKGGW